MRIATPGRLPAATAIAAAIPGFVPVHDGTMQASYRPAVRERETEVRVHVGSPFWHWLEYGTRWNPAYRPVENAVRSLGLRFEPQ
jgi:hypothetical protein